MPSRSIIQIDEEKCNGCGECILACAEGALTMVDGKAKLVREVYCDGLGACLGECPTGALTIVEREAEDFDAEEVDRHLRQAGRELSHEHDPARPGSRQVQAPAHAHGPVMACPSAGAMQLEREQKSGPEPGELVSELGHWPVKMQLLGPATPFLQGADLILTADCVPFAFPDFHRKLLRGKVVAIGCPKLDDLEAHIERLTEIIRDAGLKSLTVVHMEVPCCFGFVQAAREALTRAGSSLPLQEIVISRHGKILPSKTASPNRAAAGR